MFIPHTRKDIEKILRAVGASSVDELYRAAASVDPVDPGKLDLPPRMDIVRLMKHLETLAGKNGGDGPCFCGGGAYRHFVHPAVDQMLQRTEFLTAYTPYQPEVSQGTLQSIFEYQTMAASLLGTETANASMYDGASAAAEAVLMALRATGRGTVLVSSALHPEYRQVIRSYLQAFEGRIVELPYDDESGGTPREEMEKHVTDETACLVVGYPNFFGVIEDLGEAAEIAHGKGALLVSATAETVALGLLEAPGALGADIAVGEGLPLGLPVSFGGPGVGLFGCGMKHVKKMPGRLSGRTIDEDGNESYVLTLAMREQHIRRERATSNICTNHSLCALAVAVHLSLLGPEGFRKQAEICAHRSRVLSRKLEAGGVLSPAMRGPFFNERVMRTRGIDAGELVEELAGRKLMVGPALGKWYDRLDDCIIVSATECVDEGDMDNLCSAIGELVP